LVTKCTNFHELSLSIREIRVIRAKAESSRYPGFNSVRSINMKVIVVGGVAGGASCAARLRRLDETAEILIMECGLRRTLRPYLAPKPKTMRHARVNAA
jgi:hypothetical protein